MLAIAMSLMYYVNNSGVTARIYPWARLEEHKTTL